MRIVCACVTENRSAFMPWLLWNFQKQDHADKHLLIVDSSQEPFESRLPDIEVIRAAPGTSISFKRNLARLHAEGDALAWMDDDDWQHPKRLALMAGNMRGNTVVGTRNGWFYNLATGQGQFYLSPRFTINSALVPMPLAKSVEFVNATLRNEDVAWMKTVLKKALFKHEVWQAAHAWLCHDTNITNTLTTKRWNDPKKNVDLRKAIGWAWGQETEDQIAALRERLRMSHDC